MKKNDIVWFMDDIWGVGKTHIRCRVTEINENYVELVVLRDDDEPAWRIFTQKFEHIIPYYDVPDKKIGTIYV